MSREQSTAAYRDESAAVSVPIEDLLERMIPEEKAAQLGSVNADRLLADDGTLDVDAVDEWLEYGESKRVTFELFATRLAFHDLDMNLSIGKGP